MKKIKRQKAKRLSREAKPQYFDFAHFRCKSKSMRAGAKRAQKKAKFFLSYFHLFCFLQLVCKCKCIAKKRQK